MFITITKKIVIIDDLFLYLLYTIINNTQNMGDYNSGQRDRDEWKLDKIPLKTDEELKIMVNSKDNSEVLREFSPYSGWAIRKRALDELMKRDESIQSCQKAVSQAESLLFDARQKFMEEVIDKSLNLTF